MDDTPACDRRWAAFRFGVRCCRLKRLQSGRGVFLGSIVGKWTLPRSLRRGVIERIDNPIRGRTGDVLLERPCRAFCFDPQNSDQTFRESPVLSQEVLVLNAADGSVVRGDEQAIPCGKRLVSSCTQLRTFCEHRGIY